MKKNLLIIFIALFGLLHAQDLKVPAKLKELTEESLRNFPKMHSLDEAVNLSSLKVDMSRAAYLPIVNADASYLHLNPVSKVVIPVGAGITKGLQMNPDDNYSATLSVVQPLLDLKTPANTDKAKSDLAVTLTNKGALQAQLAYQIAQVYYGIIYLNSSINVQQMQLKLVKSTLKLIEARLKSGDALKYDLVSTQVRYTNVENYISELKAQLSKQYNLLGMLTGQSSNQQSISDSTFSDSYLDIVKDSLQTEILAVNNDIKIAEAKKIYSESDISAVKRLYLPSLNIIGGIGYKNGIAPEIYDTKFNYYYGLNFSLPIFPASRPHIQLEMAQVGLRLAQNELDYQKLSVSKDIANALEDIQKNQKKYASMDTLLQQASLAVELGTERFKEGVITSVELLTAETNYQDALLSKLQTEYNLLLSKLELSRLAGKRWW
jgi:outer membrane protein TolC